MNDTAVIHQHNHWLRVACAHPLSEPFFGLLYRLLLKTNDNFFDYKGPLPGPDERATSVAQIAQMPNVTYSIAAASHIEMVLDHLHTFSILASYLFGEGDPRRAPPLSSYPHSITLVPSSDVAANEKLMRPVSNPLPPLDEMSEFERTTLQWKPRFQCLIATVNRFYHDPKHRNGAVLGMMFLVLAYAVPEIKNHITCELLREDISEANVALIFAYIECELTAFAQCSVDYTNCHEFWSTTWGSISHTLMTNNFERMDNAITGRALAYDKVAEEVAKMTEHKRKSRGASRKRRRGSGADANVMPDVDLVNAIVGIPVDDDEDEAEDGDDDLSGIIV